MASSHYVSAVPTLERLFWTVPKLFFIPLSGEFLNLCFLPAVAVAGGILAYRRRLEGFRTLLLWPVVLILLMNFWPSSLSPYRPTMVAHARIFTVVALPLAILAAYFVRSLRATPCRIVTLLLIAVTLPAAVVVQSRGREYSSGARVAFSNLPDDEPVVSDPRTTALFRLYDGYQDSRTWLNWHDPQPDTPFLRVHNESWKRRLAEWYGAHPPPEFLDPRGELVLEAPVEGRLNLRSLLKGGALRDNDVVRIESVKPAP